MVKHATPKRSRQFATTGRDRRRLLSGLCILADYESQIKDALTRTGDRGGAALGDGWDWHHVCDALRLLIGDYDGH